MYNLKAMGRLLLFGLIILSCLPGCVPVPVRSEPPPGFVDQSTLDSLIGNNKESLLISLGYPHDVYVSEESSYFVYCAYGAEHQVVLMVWIPIFPQEDTDGRLFCVLLEFDDENIFRRYQIESHSKLWSGAYDMSYCASTFFTPEEIQLFTIRDAVVDAFSQKQSRERKNVLLDSGEYDFKQLCTAAEQGDFRARWELGYIYYNGLYGVNKDLAQSVMWYSLVEADGHNPKGVDNIREQLTPEQLIEAEHLYENWKPGRCERDLTRLVSEDYAWILYKEIETYCQNADLGHANAQTYVGDLHYLGAYGLKKNHIQAYVWYSLAATNGNLYASGQLTQLRKKLSTQQLSEAHAQLEEWKPGQCERYLTEAITEENK